MPEWDLTDRLRKSLRDAGMTTGGMAGYLGVSRQTINNWTAGKITPGIASLRAWAMVTRVPFEWLQSGGFRMLNPDGVRPCPVCAARDSNPEPADYWPVAA